ncbi:hypothetical protein MMC17_008430 [Xylographa soralifera]|nr:hypothetical protein [Xylographa soralifera]
MDSGDFDHSVILDDNHYSLPQRSSQSRSFDDENVQPSMDLHEHFHVLHMEAVERATTTEEEEPSFGAVRTQRTQRTTPLITSNYIKQSISEMKAKILTLEKQLTCASMNEELSGVMGNISAADPTRVVNVLLEDTVKDGLHHQEIIPQHVERSWSDFMNKQVGEKNEYAIEVLVEDPRYHYSKKETERIDRRKGKNRGLKLESKIRADLVKPEAGDEGLPTPDRIRINSHWILNRLVDLDRKIDTSGPMVMLRPFKFLVCYEDQIRDSVRVLGKVVA